MKRNKTPHHSEKTSWFHRILLGFVTLSLIGITLVLVHLWHYLEDYQATLPAQLSEQVLKAYRSYDTPTLRAFCDDLPDSMQDDFTYQSYLHKFINPKDMYCYESNRNELAGSITYSYVTGGQDFASLTIQRTPDISEYGFPIYEIASLEQYSLTSFTFHETAGTTIYIEGKPIAASYITEQNAVASAFDELNMGPFYDTEYVVPDDMAFGEVTARNLDGSSCPVTFDSDQQLYTSAQQHADTTMAPVAAFALQASKSYATFATIKNASRNQLLTLLCPDTAFYQTIKSYDNSWGIQSTADSFSHEEVTDFAQYSEDAFSCIVSLNYLVAQGAVEKVYPLQFQCYIIQQEGAYRLLRLEVL